MKRFRDFVSEQRPSVRELMPWDLAALRAADRELLVIDVREPGEYAAMRIPGSINVPRGVLELAAEWGYEETEPRLAEARDRPVIVVCRSGNRSLLAAHTLQLMGFREVASLRTGIRGWKDDDRLLVDAVGSAVDPEEADRYFTPRLPVQARAVAPHSAAALLRAGGRAAIQEPTLNFAATG